MRTHDYPGRLVIVEGIDGSGKSTQLLLLYKYLQATGKAVSLSEWNSSPMVKSTTSLGKKKKILTPLTFSLIHATDFADRLVNHIIPLLKAGVIVLADRYSFTAFARDAARGCDRQWVRDLYAFAIKPDLAFYFRVSLDVSVQRILTGRPKLKYYEAGMDIGLANDAVDSFKLFQQRILDEYDEMTAEFGFCAMDGTLPIERQQSDMRRIVTAMLEDTHYAGLHRISQKAAAK